MADKKKDLPWHISTFNKGADYDSEKEIIFSVEGSGKYVIARNARLVSTDGNTGAAEKIRGEELLYSNTLNNQGYTCVGNPTVNDHNIEIWGKDDESPGIITIDGQIVLKSILFQQSPQYPLQWDVNNNCIGGEFFITDDRVPPYIFNVQDMLDAINPLSPKYSPTKYFSSFDPNLYETNLTKSLDIPVFVQLVVAGGGGGLPTGSYRYTMRYVTEDGDRTNQSQSTPPIAVMQNLDSGCPQFPWLRTYGGNPDPGNKTGLGIQIRFRVTNIYNYDYIELIRYDYNQGAGIDFSPTGKIIAKIGVAHGEISVVDFVDPTDSNTNTPITVAEQSQELALVETAKTLRYYDKRLVYMNIKHPSKEAELEFLTINDKEGFPIIDNLGKAGYKDPYNHAYKKKYMNGEKYSFGVVGFDGVGTSGFVSKAPGLKNFQFPNRRDIISTETANYSYGGTVKSATVLVDNIDQTHEVFDLDGAANKTNECDFKNIIKKGKLGFTGYKNKGEVTSLCDETDAEIESHGAEVALIGVFADYHPFTPVRENDPDVEGHNYVVNSAVFTSGDDASDKVYRPNGFGPNYYAMGLMMPGIANIPRWMKSFSVVRTRPAGRVLCQGLGYYSMSPADFNGIGADSLGGKRKNKFWFHSPDIDNGMVSTETVEDIIANPQNYKLQFVSPLGFFSELYSAEDNLETEKRDRCLDMMTYVRMIRDNQIYDSGTANQINPAELSTMGYHDGDGKSYIGYERFRNSGSESGAFGGDGNKLFDIATTTRIVEGRGGYIEIETIDNIYATANIDGGVERDFEDSGLIKWTEPVYVINIIRVGATITDKNIQGYVSTGHYQKIESIIGKSNGNANQRFQLVDERWEDVIPSYSSSSYGASTDRFLYVRKESGETEKWVNVIYKTPAQLATIIATIQSAGSWNGCKGVFRGDFDDSSKRFAHVIFNVSGFIPEDGALILVRYDNTAPIRIFGGDTFVGEDIFAPIDREGNAQNKDLDKKFNWGIGLPYFRWRLNPRYYTVRKADAGVNEIQNEIKFGLGMFRQLCVMYTVESKSAMHLTFNVTNPSESFPLINYVIRPNRWKHDNSTTDNNVFQEYADDYGETEKDTWKWGGFRFLMQTNSDYAVRLQDSFFSKPTFGFVEQTKFCTRVMWSLPRAINVQDSPGLKTFPANNKFDIDDDQGDIVKAYDATTEKGENLYAFTERGICLLLTSKSILSDLNGGKVGYMAADLFVQAQYWLNKDVGMNAEWWRSAAEAFVPISDEAGSEARIEALFFSNSESSFLFMGNTCKDIGRINYYSRLKPDLDTVLPGFETQVTGIYDRKNQEYWLHIDNGEAGFVTHVFGKKNMSWYGTYDYRFDRFTSNKNGMFGQRDLKSYKLQQGFKINGEPIQFELMGGAAPLQPWDKEFVKIRVNSPHGQKPTGVQFLKTVNGGVLCELSASIPAQGALFMKDYVGFEGQIPRMVAEPRDRFQNRVILFKILHNLATDFKVIDSAVSYTVIK